MKPYIIIITTLIIIVNLIPVDSAQSVTNTQLITNKTHSITNTQLITNKTPPGTNTQSITNTIRLITNTTQSIINTIRLMTNTKSLNDTKQSLNTTMQPVNMTLMKNEFYIIANTPYNEQTNNCNNKSEDFANYLVNNNASNVSLVEIEYKDGSYSHEFVEWNGLYYDPTNNPPYFGVNENEYLQALKKVGFTGNITIIPYSKF